jgi:hypothetical protein
VEKERLVVPWADGDQVQFRPPFQDAVFKNEVAGTQAEVILDLLLDAGGFYMGITGCLDHHFWHFSKSNLRKPLKVSQISYKLTKTVQITAYG